MKIQYLGDYRDAFKWDLLHWACTRSSPTFCRLVFVPLLTLDDPVPRDGQMPHERFEARDFIHAFVAELRRAPRDIRRVAQLGTQDGETSFNVSIHAPHRIVPDHTARPKYWENFDPRSLDDCIVFLDPDNGFEIKTQRGGKWVLDAEIRWLLETLPSSSAIVVYQHWPHRAWPTVFAELARRLSFAPFLCAVHDHTLAFVALSRNADAFGRLERAFHAYAAAHPKVKYAEIRSLGA